MSGSPVSGSPVSGVVIGFYGKLPARGDFVRGGLPSDFIEPWDAWWQRGILASRERAEDWVAAWLEAPVWRFLLAPGVCGAEAVLGLWLPSVDRAGRYFPLTIAAVGATDLLTGPQAGGFLPAVEQAGLDALEQDIEPDSLGERLAVAFGPGDEIAMAVPGRSVWWTQGSGRVAQARRVLPGMPEGPAFAAMIDDSWAGARDD